MSQKTLQAIYESIIAEQKTDSNSFGYRTGKFASKIPGYTGKLVGTAGKLTGKIDYDEDESSIGNFYGKSLGKYFKDEFKKIFKPGEKDIEGVKDSGGNKNKTGPGPVKSSFTTAKEFQTNKSLKALGIEAKSTITKDQLINIGVPEGDLQELRDKKIKSIIITDNQEENARIANRAGQYYVVTTSYSKRTPSPASREKL